MNALKQIQGSMQAAASYTKLRELSDNWQYKISTSGPDAFIADLSQGSVGYAYGQNGLYYASNQYKTVPPDVLALLKDDGTLGACSARVKALADEIQKIKEHKADMVFTLLNDTKLIQWRDGLQECDDWIANRRAEITKKLAEYSPNGN